MYDGQRALAVLVVTAPAGVVTAVQSPQVPDGVVVERWGSTGVAPDLVVVQSPQVLDKVAGSTRMAPVEVVQSLQVPEWVVAGSAGSTVVARDVVVVELQSPQVPDELATPDAPTAPTAVEVLW